jgi:hypothetical protein
MRHIPSKIKLRAEPAAPVIETVSHDRPGHSVPEKPMLVKHTEGSPFGSRMYE